MPAHRPSLKRTPIAIAMLAVGVVIAVVAYRSFWIYRQVKDLPEDFLSAGEARSEISSVQTELGDTFGSIRIAEDATAATQKIDSLLKRYVKARDALFRYHEIELETQLKETGSARTTGAHEQDLQKWGESTAKQDVSAERLEQWDAIRQQRETRVAMLQQWESLKANSPAMTALLDSVTGTNLDQGGLLPGVSKVRSRLAKEVRQGVTMQELEAQKREAESKRLLTAEEDNRRAWENAASHPADQVFAMKVTSGFERLAELRFQLELGMRKGGSAANVELGGDVCIIAPVTNRAALKSAVYAVVTQRHKSVSERSFDESKWLGVMQRYEPSEQTFYVALRPETEERSYSPDSAQAMSRWENFKLRHPDNHLRLHIDGATALRLAQLRDTATKTVRKLNPSSSTSLSASYGDILLTPVPDIEAFLGAAKLGEITRQDLLGREVWVKAQNE